MYCIVKHDSPLMQSCSFIAIYSCPYTFIYFIYLMNYFFSFEFKYFNSVVFNTGNEAMNLKCTERLKLIGSVSSSIYPRFRLLVGCLINIWSVGLFKFTKDAGKLNFRRCYRSTVFDSKILLIPFWRAWLAASEWEEGGWVCNRHTLRR